MAFESLKKDVLRTKEIYAEELYNFGFDLKGLIEAAQNYHIVLEENRKLYNEVQDLKGLGVEHERGEPELKRTHGPGVSHVAEASPRPRADRTWPRSSVEDDRARPRPWRSAEPATTWPRSALGLVAGLGSARGLGLAAGVAAWVVGRAFLRFLRPDISAVGLNIFAAFSPLTSISGNVDDTRTSDYNVLLGTSMSCPHVSAVAAYVKSFHPDWSPAIIKSALMTTVSPATGKDGLNYPTINHDVRANINITNFDGVYHRIAMDVGDDLATYKAQIESPKGLSIEVSPSILLFKNKNEKKSFKVTLSGSYPKEIIRRLSGSIIWSDTIHDVCEDQDSNPCLKSKPSTFQCLSDL
nr:subtilisin-like protease SBT4.15 [Ipomoea trifida]